MIRCVYYFGSGILAGQIMAQAFQVIRDPGSLRQYRISHICIDEQHAFVIFCQNLCQIE